MVCLAVVSFFVIAGYLVKTSKLSDNSPVVAEVDKTKIHLKEYNEWAFASTKMGSPDKPYVDNYVKDSILNTLTESKVIEQELAKRKISISQTDITSRAQKDFPDYSKKDELSKKAYEQFAKYKIGGEKLSGIISTWREGYALFCRFDRGYQDDMKDKKEESADLLKKEEPYAKDFCQGVKDQLTKGSSYDTEYQKIAGDPVIGREAWSGVPVKFGKQFDKSMFSADFFQPYQDAFDQILKLSPHEGDNYYLLTLKSKSFAGQPPSMYGVVYLKGKGNTGEVANTYLGWLKEIKSKYNIKTYPERLKI